MFFSVLEKEHKVNIITQNIDNLHEKAGSSNVLHFYGQLDRFGALHFRARFSRKLTWRRASSVTKDKDNWAHLLQPDIVLYGQPIDALNQMKGFESVSSAEVLLVLGTYFRRLSSCWFSAPFKKSLPYLYQQHDATTSGILQFDTPWRNWWHCKTTDQQLRRKPYVDFIMK